MPTKRPRINVTITPELHQALVEFRRASGMSSASLISQLLSETVPVINAMEGVTYLRCVFNYTCEPTRRAA